MFFFKKKELVETFFSTSNGEIVDLSSVEDAVFSQKMMGDGFAVRPSDDAVYSPVSGTIMGVFPTKHAITIESDQGLEILIHMGINTVELNGEPFEVLVSEGQKVTEQTQLATMNLAMLAEKEVLSDIMVIITNQDKVKEQVIPAQKNVKAMDKIGTVTVNK